MSDITKLIEMHRTNAREARALGWDDTAKFHEETANALERLSTTPEVTIDDAMVERALRASHSESHLMQFSAVDHARMRRVLRAALNTPNKE